MFEACPEAQREIHSEIALFDSAVCDRTKGAIAKNSIYDRGLARFALTVAYETCEKLAVNLNEKEEQLAV